MNSTEVSSLAAHNTRAGIATRPEKCLQNFRLVVTAQYTYHIPLLSIDRPRLIIDINHNH
jgi:hypothetical protein